MWFHVRQDGRDSERLRVTSGAYFGDFRPSSVSFRRGRCHSLDPWTGHRHFGDMRLFRLLREKEIWRLAGLTLPQPYIQVHYSIMILSHWVIWLWSPVVSKSLHCLPVSFQNSFLLIHWYIMKNEIWTSVGEILNEVSHSHVTEIN